MKTAALFAFTFSLMSAVAAMGASEAFHAGHDIGLHRRHHARRSSVRTRHRRRASGKCSSKSSTGQATASSSSGASTSTGTSSSSTGTTSTSNSTSSSNSTAISGDCGDGFISVSGVCVGMLPDGGSDGGSSNTMASLNNLVTSLNSKMKYFGQYAQAQSGTDFDGNQLLQVMDDLKASGAIFQPAVMPTGGWEGLTADDNSQAVNICNVMKKFTDEGIEVWLRFAHEVNWYLTDGTYSGSVSDFKAGWAAVASACKSIAPDVKMFFTPNIADISTYEEFFPDDASTVDVIGVDYYPNQSTDLSSAFLSAMQPFHDKYCSSSTIFAIGETGLGYSGSAEEKTQWLSGMVSAKSDMQYLHGVAWFNYQKGYNFKVVDPDDSSTTSAFISWAQGN